MSISFDVVRPSDGVSESEARTMPPSPRVGEEQLPYVLSPDLATAINVAITVDQPLLVTGEPGCGKTMLAWEVARQLGASVLPFYTKSTAVARDLLYRFDTVRRFHDASVQDDKSRDASSYVTFAPLGEAIRSEETKVVLIDEVDKAPRDFTNDLLRELDRMEFTVPEVDPPPTYRAKARHFILITSNSERLLPEPFLRRCVYEHVDFPAPKLLKQIVELHLGDRLPSEEFAELAVTRFLELRAIRGLAKRPGTSELVGWVRVLVRMGTEEATLRQLQAEQLPARQVLVKRLDDLRKLAET